MLLDRRIYREPSVAGTVTYGDRGLSADATQFFARMFTSVTAGLEEGGGSKGRHSRDVQEWRQTGVAKLLLYLGDGELRVVRPPVLHPQSLEDWSIAGLQGNCQLIQKICYLNGRLFLVTCASLLYSDSRKTASYGEPCLARAGRHHTIR